MQRNNRVLVVGGGAAGMMAAAAAAESGASVCLVEKNEKLGKKLFSTGKGRCNVTNAADVETLLSNVCTNRKFLYSAFYDFDNRALMKWLEKAGCPLKVERGERVFPVSDHSSDVIAALRRELIKRDVKILLNREVESLLLREPKQDEKGAVPSRREIAGVRFPDGSGMEADSVIVCTGGCSYPSTGSTGDGYRFARDCGHTVTTLRPSLVPMNAKEEDVRSLQGLSLKNVEISVLDGEKELYREFGEMLFTHFGVSGPLVLSASSFVGKILRERPLRMQIDLKPALTDEQLDARLLRDFAEASNRQFSNALGRLYPAKLIPVMVARSGIRPEKPVRDITRQERQRLLELTKHFAVTLTGLRGFEEAIITQGGVSVKEISPSTMESKKVRGLYFAGEVLDLDAVTGGFNLQIAWSTGWAAGSSVRWE